MDKENTILNQSYAVHVFNQIARVMYYAPVSVDPKRKCVTVENGWDRIGCSHDSFLAELFTFLWYAPRGYTLHRETDDWKLNSKTGSIERIVQTT